MGPVDPTRAGGQPAVSAPVLDQEHMSELLDAMGANDVRELIAEFQRNMPPRLAGVMEVVDGDDLAVLGHRAHGMISAASPLGLMELALSAREVERLCLVKDAAAARGLARTLPDLVERGMRSLGEWLSAHAGKTGS